MRRPPRKRGTFRAQLRCPTGDTDGLLERPRFEPPVPLQDKSFSPAEPKGRRGEKGCVESVPILGRTEGSNPSCSSSESATGCAGTGGQSLWTSQTATPGLVTPLGWNFAACF